jgi:hypothetical protein
MKVTRLSVVAHRAVGLAACGLLMLVLHASFIERVGAIPPKPSGNLIRVWTVGSPQTDALPPAVVPAALQRQAENLGYTIEVQTFPAAGLAAKFRQALQDQNEPEVLTFDNYGVVMGIRTPSGWIEGVASDGQAFSSFVLVHEAFAPLQPRGWVMLVRSAANYEAARALSMQPPVCGAESALAGQLLTPTELRQTLETAAMAAHAYLACDHTSLSAISDESRLGQKCFLPESDTQVDGVKACSVSGNHNLVFVSLVSTFAAQLRAPRYYSGALPNMDLGHQSILAVLRNQGGAWRLLAITADPLDTVATIPLTTQRVGSLLVDGRTAGAAPDPARLLTPDGAYPRPAQGERFGDFTWRPSQSADVIGQVVEFMFGDNSDRGRTRLFFPDAREGKLSSGYLMSGGTTSWRVWSISKGGEVAFSEQRSYRH